MGAPTDEARAEAKQQAAVAAAEANEERLRYTFEFAGVPLLIPTPEVEAWISRHIPLKPIFNAPHTPASPWPCIPQEQWPDVPELNTLYFPMGCNRWGFGAFLFSGAYLSQLRDVIVPDGSPESGAGMLAMGDPEDPDHYVESWMYGLHPIPVSACPESDDSHGLYILPLVCPRFLYQYSDATATFVGDSRAPDGRPGLATDAFWENMRFDFARDYGLATFSEIPEPLRYIDSYAASQTGGDRFCPSGQMFEALCWSMGVTFIPELDASSASFVSVEDGESQWDAFIGKLNDDTFKVVAGHATGYKNRAEVDEFVSCALPSEIVFAYTRGEAGLQDHFDLKKEWVVTAQEAAGVDGVGFIDWVVGTCIAESFEIDEHGDQTGEVDPAWTESFNVISSTLARSWYTMAMRYCDITLAGICNVPLSPFTNCIEWSMNMRGPMTRIRGRHRNTFPTRILTQIQLIANFPAEFEIVRFVTGDTVQWRDRSFLIGESPTILPGYAPFSTLEEGTPLLAAYDRVFGGFAIVNQPPLDFDVIYQEIKDRLEEDGLLD